LIMSKKMLFLVACTLCASMLFSQSKELFSFNGDYIAPKDVVSAGTKLTLNKPLLRRLNQNRPAKVEVKIALKNEVLTLKLDRAELFNFNRADVVLASTLKQYHFSPGYYLRGKIEGKENSLVALSIFENGAGGVLSFNNQNYNLCVANAANDFTSSDYILYSEKDCNAMPPACNTVVDDKPISLPNYSQRPLSAVGCPVDMYFELGNEMYTGLGSNSANVLRYFTILFNCMQTLYMNENILVQIREIKIWDVPEPEANVTSTRDALDIFSQRMDNNNFNGDLAHYATFNNLGGGIAWRDQLCNNNRYYCTAVSANLRENYSAFPNYSFSVEVITHETGHNIGSPHTHNCSWPGGPIDNCYPVDGGPCSAGPSPAVGGGTVMSYCHLSAIGINFANGFGPLPGDLIRSKVTDASNINCICDCSNIEIDIATQDIGCGNPLGSAAPVITNGGGPFTFLWSNGSTDSVATGLSAGTYYVTVTGRGTGCTVVKGCKINSTGNAVTTNISPAATTVTKCVNENYTMTVSVSPVGSYTYQWYKDNVAVTGATTNSFTANATGAYYAKVSSASCTGQSQTINVSIQNIAAFTVGVNGASNICVNDSVRLSVPATVYSIEWLFNGSVIPGATSTNYFAKTAGDYTVRLFSATNGSCNRVSPPVSIQVKPSPLAGISPTGNIEICKGRSATLSHTSVAGNTYQWYNGTTALSGETNNVLTRITAGQYQLVVTNANGCISKSNVANIIVNPLPDSAISPFPSFSLCQGGSLKLEVKPATSNATYNWYDDNELIGTTSENYFTVTQRGAYSAAIKNNTTGCQSTSDVTTVNMIPPPTIFAGNDTVLATGQPYRLRAFETSGLGVTRYEWSPSTGLNDPNVASPVATLYADQLYTVKGIHPLGCYGTATIKFTVYKGPAMYIPTAFSPNGDGLNDILKCFAVGLQSFKYFDIYNRNGERIFRTTNPTKGWDGTYKGTPVDPATYVWVAEGIDYTGKPMVQRGTVVVVR
jgi:gliding motility-associated-like protein